MSARVSMACAEPVLALKDRYGGSVCIDKSGLKRKDGYKRKVIYSWTLASGKADVFFRDIFPYLIVKKEVVDLAIKFRKIQYSRHRKNVGQSRQKAKLSPEEIKERLVYRNKIMSLNALN